SDLSNQELPTVFGGPSLACVGRISRIEEESRGILFSRHPFEFHVEGGTEVRRLSVQRHQVGFRHPVLSPHLADHELRVAADQICVTRTSLPLEFVYVAKQEDEPLIVAYV